MSRIAYKSNGGTIGDGTRITRVSGGGQKLEVMVDEKTGRFSEVVLVADAPAEPEPEPEPPVGPTPPDPDPAPPPPDPGPAPIPQPGTPGAAITTETELRTALGNAKAGDVLPVAGNFPAITLTGVKFNGGKVTIKGSHAATLEQLTLNGCANMRLESFKVMPKGVFTKVGGAIPFLLKGDGATTDIEVEDCDLWGGPDAPNYLNWTLAEWNAQKVGGIQFMGQRVALRDNCALAVNFGYSVLGSDMEFTRNRVAGFSADAFRGNANNLTATGNWATDAYAIDSNHPDGIQVFGRYLGTKGQYELIQNQLWEDTIIMEYSTPTDTRGSLGASLQLIGYHNPPYKDITHRLFVGSSSSFNAYGAGNIENYVAEKVMMFTVSGPSGGTTKLGVTRATSLTDIYLDDWRRYTTPPSLPTTGKPDYSKLPAFKVAAIRGNQRPDIRAILGW